MRLTKFSRQYRYFIFYFCITLFFIFSSNLLSLDPLSKIVITSESVNVRPVDKTEGLSLFLCTYTGNVCVTLADGSTIKADSMQATLNKPDNVNSIKKIIFNNNVQITSDGKTVTADQAELYLENKKCTATGNVKVIQYEKESNNKTVEVACNSTQVNFETKEVSFAGAENQPVSTTINLSKKIKKSRHE